ncbi:MAG: tRNA-dihydrouridine synthase, partial [Pseudomonadota bacterium]
PDIARRAEAAGVSLLTIHGRTRAQFYSGQADWAAIRAVREAVRIPVLANGDIIDARSARAALAASGADGVMVGRGAQGRPWQLATIMAELAGQPAPATPQSAELFDLIAAHYEEMLEFYGRELGLRIARKHLGWYLAPLGATALRARLMRLDCPKTVLATLRSGLCSDPLTEAQAA